VTDTDRRQHWVELLGTILLAVAAVATAWSTYQSIRWRGEQAVDTSRANAARVEATQAATRGGQQTQVDIALFVQWINASTEGDADLAAFYRRRFRPEFRPAFRAWLATNPRTNRRAPLSPFAMPQYRVAESIESDRLNAEAGAHSDEAGSANQRADDYALAVVLFAVSLFFAGIATKLRSARQREALLALGWVIFLSAAVWLVTLPVSL
jgi:hypothetical protein